jgi:hypothetical protein
MAIVDKYVPAAKLKVARLLGILCISIGRHREMTLDATAISENNLGITHYYTLVWFRKLAIFHAGHLEGLALDILHALCQVDKARDAFNRIVEIYQEMGRIWLMSLVTPFNGYR